MEGTSVACRQRRTTPRTRRWSNTLESTGGREPRFGDATARRVTGVEAKGARLGARERSRDTMRPSRTDFGPRGKNDRRGTAAAMRSGYRRGEAFEGYSAGEEPALVRDPTARSGRRRDPEKPSEPQVRNRAETCAGPEVGGSRRGGGKPRGRSTKSWCGSHDPRDRCFGIGPGVDDRGERRRRGVPRMNPRRGWRYRSREGHGPSAPHRERWTRSEGEEAARRIGETSRRAPCRTTRPSGREGGTDREAGIGDDERQGGDREGRPSGDQQGEGGRPPRPRAPAT